MLKKTFVINPAINAYFTYFFFGKLKSNKNNNGHNSNTHILFNS